MKKAVRSGAKKRLRTAGALTAKKAAKPTPMMVERAISQASRARFRGQLVGKVLSREVLEAISRAVIKSMRNPTKEVIQWAGMAEIGSVWEADFGNGYKKGVTFPICIALRDTGCRDADKALLAAWREMIDAALEAKPHHRPRAES